LFPSTASVSVVMVWMILGSIGALMRTPNGKQCTGKEKQSEFFFSQAEQKRSNKAERCLWRRGFP
jgi:hypothetical protein